MDFNKDYYCKTIKEILEIDSPSGFTNLVTQKIIDIVTELGFSSKKHNNGSITVDVLGESNEVLAFCAHVDTLGLMVRSINSDGTLSFEKVGGVNLTNVDGEYIKVYTKNGEVYTGVVYSNAYSMHVHKKSTTLERDCDNMHIILDEEVSSKEDVKKLGIQNGDFICLNTNTVITESGFIKSRFLDDKASVAILLTYLKYISDTNYKPKKSLRFLFSVNEEIGYGMSYLDNDISELIAVDMGCIGEDLECSEYQVSICAKDSSGPYNYDIVKKMTDLCTANDVDYAIDIYPMYSSDASAALRAGHNIRCGLIGMGVRASHGVERTHIKGISNTLKLIDLYIKA